MWAELAEEPVFVLTADQDWAPAWALERQLELTRAAGAPLHLFVTSDDPALRAPADGLSLGIHPNFLPNSSHGADVAAALDFCMELVPGATTARTHAFAEDTYTLAALARRGIRADSNLCVMLQPGLVPLLHVAGVLRFPVFLEDDVLLRWAGGAPPLDAIAGPLFTPGLKILNFHPSLVAINARTAEDYPAAHDALFGGRGEPVAAHADRGVGDLLADLLAEIDRRGHRIAAFPDVVARAESLVGAAFPEGILGWRPGRPW